VEDVMIHEKWNPRNVQGGFDVALVRLKKPTVLYVVRNIFCKSSYILKPYSSFFRMIQFIHW